MICRSNEQSEKKRGTTGSHCSCGNFFLQSLIDDNKAFEAPSLYCLYESNIWTFSPSTVNEGALRLIHPLVMSVVVDRTTEGENTSLVTLSTSNFEFWELRHDCDVIHSEIPNYDTTTTQTTKLIHCWIKSNKREHKWRNTSKAEQKFSTHPVAMMRQLLAVLWGKFVSTWPAIPCCFRKNSCPAVWALFLIICIHGSYSWNQRTFTGHC